MYDNESDFQFYLSGWKSITVVVVFLFFAGWYHHHRWYHNPDLDESIEAMLSDDPAVIGETLYRIRKLTMGKGHKLIPYILPHLSNSVRLPTEIEQKLIKDIQSTPGALSGLGVQMRGSFTIGSTAALTLQSLVNMDVQNLRWVGGRARDTIVEYVVDVMGLDCDEFTITNGLGAVRHIHDKELIPYWFQCLKFESETIRIHALAGIYFYVHDRVHGINLFDWKQGIFTWYPEREITPAMYANLKECLNDSSSLIRAEAQAVIDQLQDAGYGA